MPIQDIFGFTLNAYVSSSMTVYTPSNVTVQGAISLAKHIGIIGAAWIEQVNIPGYGELQLGVNTSTVRWELNSITFTVDPDHIGTILVAVYSG